MCGEENTFNATRRTIEPQLNEQHTTVAPHWLDAKAPRFETGLINCPSGTGREPGQASQPGLSTAFNVSELRTFRIQRSRMHAQRRLVELWMIHDATWTLFFRCDNRSELLSKSGRRPPAIQLRCLQRNASWAVHLGLLRLGGKGDFFQVTYTP